MAKIPIAGSYSLSEEGTVVTFNPTSPLPYEAMVYVKATPTLRSVDNERLATDFDSMFSTELYYLEIAGSVWSGSSAIFSFNEPLDPLTVIADNITIEGPEGAITGVWSTELNGEAKFAVTGFFPTDVPITVTFKDEVKGVDGEVMEETTIVTYLYVMSLPTIEPENADVDVAVNTNIEAIFPREIDETTVNTTTFAVTYDDGL